MRVIYKVSDELTFELEGSTQKDIFEELSSVGEVFGGSTSCGKCQSTNVHFRMRKVDANKFFEKSCGDCGASLSYGCHRVGDTLFKKVKNEDGSWIDNRGWVRYVPPAK
jgi:hypothetical protein